MNVYAVCFPFSTPCYIVTSTMLELSIAQAPSPFLSDPSKCGKERHPNSRTCPQTPHGQEDPRIPLSVSAHQLGHLHSSFQAHSRYVTVVPLPSLSHQSFISLLSLPFFSRPQNLYSSKPKHQGAAQGHNTPIYP
jgi:hypothetical protein